MGKYGDFYEIGPWGFSKASPEDHAPSPKQFQPEHLSDPKFYEKGYHVEELGDGVHWVTSPSGYDAAFVTTGSGVIAIDAPPTLGENMLAAIESVTDEPVTHVIYSHWHSDHIGAAAMYGPDVKIVAHEITRELLARFPDPLRPLPTETFSTDETLDVGGVRLELSYKGADHCPGNIYIYAPRQKVLTKIDIVSPGSVTFMYCDASENISGWLQAHDQILEYDFNALVGGHIMRYGTREDVITSREYFHDLQSSADEAIAEMSSTMDARMEFYASLSADQVLVGTENWINSMVNYATEKTLNKVTSNGQKWPERLAGATVWTKNHAYTVVEATRLERTHNGYQQRGAGGPEYIV
ncbi:MBL fold metallo-hydrolase [Frankia tisae]|uniref:MBL fold metallo-hydrolase n=1 Tax=Frankia tisae TaxID=2950104 RepID=UPI0021C1613D|nr:MBL fold metallo-hydrolase [Frankia tisae]